VRSFIPSGLSAPRVWIPAFERVNKGCALTGEGRNSSRSHCARDGHRFESPQIFVRNKYRVLRDQTCLLVGADEFSRQQVRHHFGDQAPPSKNGARTDQGALNCYSGQVGVLRDLRERPDRVQLRQDRVL
jgi:hypothetical protein